MSVAVSHPDFSQHGLQIIRRLGLNSYSSRSTYLAKYKSNDKKVVIKQFRFGIAESSLEAASALKSIEREISALQRLDHPQIPKYLGTFQNHNSYCLVQEYVDAPNLASFSDISPQQIKHIAVQVLNILVYVHSMGLKHRDIKPENILVQANFFTHLIDFGLSVIGTGSLSASSALTGTLGFMPPEQFTRRFTPSSDLYSLGITLICLLTKTKTADVPSKFFNRDSGHQIKFRHLLLETINPRLIEWLEKMVQVEPRQRYQNPQEALKELEPLNVYKCPTVSIVNSSSTLVANRIRQKITHRLTIKNITPGTKLQGCLEIEDHRNDRSSKSWISLSSTKISGNNTTIDIIVDTKQLMPGSVFNRNVLLRSNAEQSVIPIPIRVRTAYYSTDTKYPPVLYIASLFLAAGLLPIIVPLISIINNLSN